MEKITGAFSNLSQCPGCTFCSAPKGQMRGLSSTPYRAVFFSKMVHKWIIPAVLLTHFCLLPSLRFVRSIKNIWLLISLLQRFLLFHWKRRLEGRRWRYFRSSAFFWRCWLDCRSPPDPFFAGVIEAVTVLWSIRSQQKCSRLQLGAQSFEQHISIKTIGTAGD